MEDEIGARDLRPEGGYDWEVVIDGKEAKRQTLGMLVAVFALALRILSALPLGWLVAFALLSEDSAVPAWQAVGSFVWFSAFDALARKAVAASKSLMPWIN